MIDFMEHQVRINYMVAVVLITSVDKRVMIFSMLTPLLRAPSCMEGQGLMSLLYLEIC